MEKNVDRNDSEETQICQNKTVAYKDIGIYPVCGSDDLFVSREDDGYGTCWYQAECQSCGATWKQDFHMIEIQDGYSDVQDSNGNEVCVTIADKPVLDAESVIELIPLCTECDSDFCAFNPEGICRYPLVYGKEPEHGFQGCEGMLVSNGSR